MTDATRAAAAAERSPPTAKRGRASERTWADVRQAARVAREEGVLLRVHRRGCVDVIGVLKQHTKTPRPVVHKVQRKPVEAAEPKLPSTAADDTSPPSLSKRKQRSAERLQDYQEKKRAAMLLKQQCAIARRLGGLMWRTNIRSEEVVRRAKLRVKLRSLLWRAWARYRPIFGGVVLGYTSLREQHVYKRAAKLYAAAFSLDPGKSGRPLAAWFRHATPMETDAGSVGSQRAKKSRGSRVRALSVA